MGARDATHKMDGIAEMDEAFFGAADEGGKRGRGAEKTAVMVSVSLTENGKLRFARMKVVVAVNGTVAKGSEIRPDGPNIYPVLGGNGYSLARKEHSPKKQPEHPRWTRVVISNTKAFVEGTFHGLDGIHLRRYPDEFCYRFNRRWMGGRGFLPACHSVRAFRQNDLS
jgi:hypothetical protein